jgi:NDP-sugar pyrophosphorylase family protein
MTHIKRAVVLAGGQGQRLRPYTTVLPKPLLPVGDQPILRRVLGALGAAGFRDVTLSVGHLAELIMLFFGDGSKEGMRLTYAVEETPLNTIGPLAFIDGLGDDFLVMNGDVLTDLDLEALWQDHLASGAILTIATHTREVRIDFGVLQHQQDHRVTAFVEKPRLPYTVSMGVYILNKRCLDYVPKGKPFGFDQLVLALLAAQEHIRSFPHRGKWLDLGRPEDYETANETFP